MKIVNQHQRPVNKDDLTAEEQDNFFENLTDEMWKEPTSEDEAAFVKILGKGPRVGMDENDNLVYSGQEEPEENE